MTSAFYNRRVSSMMSPAVTVRKSASWPMAHSTTDHTIWPMEYTLVGPCLSRQSDNQLGRSRLNLQKNKRVLGRMLSELLVSSKRDGSLDGARFDYGTKMMSQSAGHRKMVRVTACLILHWAPEDGALVMTACLILHNMIIDDEGFAAEHWALEDGASTSHGIATPRCRWV